MNGSDFKAGLKAAGYTQAGFAQLMGVHRETIGKQCQAEQVESYWAYALAGVVAIEGSKAVSEIAKKIDK